MSALRVRTRPPAACSAVLSLAAAGAARARASEDGDKRLHEPELIASWCSRHPGASRGLGEQGVSPDVPEVPAFAGMTLGVS